MSNDNRQINMTRRPITTNTKGPGGIDLRDLVLYALAVVQAGYWVFVNEALPFAARLVAALACGMVFMGAAMVRPHGKTFEQLFWHWLSKHVLRPNFATHQTAERDATTLKDPSDIAGRAAQQRSHAASDDDLPSLPVSEWFAPNYALLVLFFMTLLAMASAALVLREGMLVPFWPRFVPLWR
jgi:hypothetical protein